MSLARTSFEGRSRIIIEKVWPEIDCGRFPIRRIVGETVRVEADVFADGHEELAARVLYRRAGSPAAAGEEPSGGADGGGPTGGSNEGPTGGGSAGRGRWREVPMRPLVNDRWAGEFTVSEVGEVLYTLEGCIEPFATWRRDLRKRLQAGQDISVELLIGARLLAEAAARAPAEEGKRLQELARKLEKRNAPDALVSAVLDEETSALLRLYGDRSLARRYEKQLRVRVEPERAGFGAWYEFFPRSTAVKKGAHGSFKDAERLLPEIAALGFDVVYLPPIHPIGRTNRKGRNNSTRCGPRDPGSPWAIGAVEGGHRTVHPQLGSLEDFRDFLAACRRHGLEPALDIAFQCSPDHPYVKEHPEWFKWRPDGTVQYAENPPKKYEDILPLNFETEAWQELWEELAGVVLFWAGQGVKIFRIDNPHTKPFAFWEYLIGEVKGKHPETIFLAEAFTRPKVMYRLAKAGFTQSYTYFTWRNTKKELSHYLNELGRGEVREYFLPSFWPNTPDILPEHLQYGGRAAFILRLVLAATLSANYGIYGPAYELCVHHGLPGREEYLDAEKYEIKHWDRDREGNIKELIARINRIRKDNEALQKTWNLSFLDIDNQSLLAYTKTNPDGSNLIAVVVNLDPYQPQSGTLELPLEQWDIAANRPFQAHELLADSRHIWQGPTRTITLDPDRLPAAIFRIHRRLHREQDFDYYM